MSLAGILMWAIVVCWVAGGTIWLLSHRSYRLYQIPRFAMDLLGFPVELAQSIWGRGGVPYALLLPNMLIFGDGITPADITLNHDPANEVLILNIGTDGSAIKKQMMTMTAVISE